MKRTKTIVVDKNLEGTIYHYANYSALEQNVAIGCIGEFTLDEAIIKINDYIDYVKSLKNQ